MTPEGLAAIHRAAFGAEKGWSAATLAAHADHPGAVLELAPPEDPAAFALLRVTLDEAEVLTLATDPSRRREGLARAALTRALDRARARGAARVLLEVAENNAPARALYDRLGFRTVATRKDYYRTPDGSRTTALVMARDL